MLCRSSRSSQRSEPRSRPLDAAILPVHAVPWPGLRGSHTFPVSGPELVSHSICFLLKSVARQVHVCASVLQQCICISAGETTHTGIPPAEEMPVWMFVAFSRWRQAGCLRAAPVTSAGDLGPWALQTSAGLRRARPGCTAHGRGGAEASIPLARSCGVSSPDHGARGTGHGQVEKGIVLIRARTHPSWSLKLGGSGFESWLHQAGVAWDLNRGGQWQWGPWCHLVGQRIAPHTVWTECCLHSCPSFPFPTL